MEKKVFYIKQYGGLGDTILVSPSFKALKEKFPGSKIIFYADPIHKELFKNNPYLDEIRLAEPPKVVDFFPKLFKLVIYYIRNYKMLVNLNTSWPETMKFVGYVHRMMQSKKNILSVNYPSLSPRFYQKNATEMIAEMLDVTLIDKKIEVFLTKEEDEAAIKLLSEYNNPIGINPTSRAAINSEWPLDRWEKLIESMPDHTFLQLGNSDEPLIEGVIDLRGKTSLRETMALLKNLQAYVGVVSFLSHLVAAFETPGIILFGPSNPDVWGHNTNINIYKNLHCSPCVDFFLKEQCPYGRECLTTISVEEVRKTVLTAISKREKTLT